MLALLEILQSGGVRRVADLAERLEVDERTVRRYVDHLLDLDVPVESVRGRYGGYQLAPGYRMAPLMLSDDEAVAVLLGLLAGRRSGIFAGSVAAESAAAKLQRVLPARLGRRMQSLLATVSLTAPQQAATAVESRVLLELAEAAREQRPVAIAYTSRAGRRTERTLHPQGIVAHAGRWYVTAVDPADAQRRTFRLDRITTTTPLPGSFEVPADVDPAADLLDSLAGTPWTHQVSLRVRGSAEQVEARLPLGLARVRSAGAGSSWVRVILRAERLDWVPALVAGLDLAFVIEEPAQLRDLVRGYAQRLGSYADASADD